MTYSETIEALQTALNNAEVMKLLSRADRGQLLLLARAREMVAGQVLFFEGDLSTDEVVLVVEGEIEVLKVGTAEVEETLTSPEFLGEIGPSTMGRRRRTVRAKTTLRLLRWPLDTLTKEAPEVAKRFLEVVEARAFSRLAADLGPRP